MRIFIIVMMMVISVRSLAQSYILPNEQNIFSFQTVGGKKVVMAKDTSDKYIVYRFGTLGKIEFEFPKDKINSWSKFEYSFYFRGGGKQNDGMELNYLQFTNEGYKYVIYSKYFASGNQSKVGVKVIQLNNENVIDIKGIVKSRKGSLVEFRDDEKISRRNI